MPSFNKVILVGYLGRDPELRYVGENGQAVCNFSIATTEKRRNARGENEEFTTWFKVTVWGRQGELSNEYLAKGRQVYVEGRLRLEEYTDRDGNRRSSLVVNATDVQFIGPRNAEAEAPQAAGQMRRVTRQEVAQAFAEQGADDEVPF